MTISTTPQIDQLIQQHLAAGGYESEQAVLLDALRALAAECAAEPDPEYRRQLADLKAKVLLAEEQSSRGESAPFDVNATMTRIEERLAGGGDR